MISAMLGSCWGLQEGAEERKARRKESARATKESVQAAMALDPTWPVLSVAHSSRRCDPFPAVVSCAPRRYILASPLL